MGVAPDKARPLPSGSLASCPASRDRGVSPCRTFRITVELGEISIFGRRRGSAEMRVICLANPPQTPPPRGYVPIIAKFQISNSVLTKSS